MSVQSSYHEIYAGDELRKRRDTAMALLKECQLCPRGCMVNRLDNDIGFCKTGRLAMVSSYNAHFGEERPLVGAGGSGTIFFTNCNLGCVFCQNYEISHHGDGVEVTAGQLAAMMVSLEKQGCHNINLVTPSHVVPQILEALPLAIDKGLTVPLVYNSSGYDRLETLELLDGIIDIYMPDFKFWDPESAKRYVGAFDYPEQARAAVKEMQRQVGELALNEQGVAERGLLVRHLVLPGGLAETGQILKFIAEEISPATYVNVMDQYHPCGDAYNFVPLDRPLSQDAYQQALKLAYDVGLTRLDQRDFVELLCRLGFV